MSVTMEFPEHYGYVVLTTVVGPFFSGLVMGGSVAKARKEFNVPYPNLYATPGYHKQADAFNRVQRGHQNIFETLGMFSLMALVGGIKHPIICSICSILFQGGGILYQIGYSDTALDVATARYKKGGAVKWLGLFGAMGCAISAAGTMNKWW